MPAAAHKNTHPPNPSAAGGGRPREGRPAAAGGVLWVLVFVLTGYWFGNMPVIKNNFSLVIIALVLIPGIPSLAEFIRIQLARRRKTRQQAQPSR